MNNSNNKITLEKINESFFILKNLPNNLIKIITENLSVYAEGYQFNPAYRMGQWDGKVRFYKIQNGILIIPYGFLYVVENFLKKNKLQYNKINFIEKFNFDINHFNDFLKSIKLPFKPYDYQYIGAKLILEEKRKIIQAATGAGKSFIMYLAVRYLHSLGYKTLIIVPNIPLTLQLHSDFKSYGWDNADDEVKLIGGEFNNKDLQTHNTIISTWQSLARINSEEFKKIDCIINDECLHPLTKIKTINGEKYIRDIKIGDLVLSYNEKIKKYEYKPVLKVHKNLSQNEDMYEIKLDNNRTLKITGNHKVFTQRGWVRADELTVDDEILKIPEDNIEENIESLKNIISIKKIKSKKPNNVYNLHIKDNHNYFAESVLVHNCHLAKADVLNDILTKSENSFIRVGLTGTVPKVKADKLKLISVFGQVKKLISPQGLIEKGLATPVEILLLYFLHPKKRFRKYQDEIKYLDENTKRIDKISKIVNKVSENQNSLVLFNTVEFGKSLLIKIIKEKLKSDSVKLVEKITNKEIEKILEEKVENVIVISKEDKLKLKMQLQKRNVDFNCNIFSTFDLGVYLVYGGIKSSVREQIRNQIEDEKGSIIVGSFKTMSTGINIKNLHNIFITSTTKSFFTIMQGIGRGMRLHKSKSKIRIWDIIDIIDEVKENYALRHSQERIEIYYDCEYPIIEKEIKL